jgi:serine/threonine-protein kinase HipA
LTEAEAAKLIEHQLATIAQDWQSVCEEAELTEVDRKLFAGRQFLNNYALEGLHGHSAWGMPTAAHRTH